MLKPDFIIVLKSGFSILSATSNNDEDISIETSIIAPIAPIRIPPKIIAFKSMCSFN